MAKFSVFLDPIHDRVLKSRVDGAREHELDSDHHEVTDDGRIVQSQASKDREAQEAADLAAAEEAERQAAAQAAQLSNEEIIALANAQDEEHAERIIDDSEFVDPISPEPSAE